MDAEARRARIDDIERRISEAKSRQEKAQQQLQHPRPTASGNKDINQRLSELREKHAGAKAQVGSANSEKIAQIKAILTPSSRASADVSGGGATAPSGTSVGRANGADAVSDTGYHAPPTGTAVMVGVSDDGGMYSNVVPEAAPAASARPSAAAVPLQTMGVRDDGGFSNRLRDDGGFSNAPGGAPEPTAASSQPHGVPSRAAAPVPPGSLFSQVRDDGGVSTRPGAKAPQAYQPFGQDYYSNLVEASTGGDGGGAGAAFSNDVHEVSKPAVSPFAPQTSSGGAEAGGAGCKLVQPKLPPRDRVKFSGMGCLPCLSDGANYFITDTSLDISRGGLVQKIRVEDMVDVSFNSGCLSSKLTIKTRTNRDAVVIKTAESQGQRAYKELKSKLASNRRA